MLYLLSYMSITFISPCQATKPLPKLERAAGIEPASSAWKAEVLPLNYAREPSNACQPFGKNPAFRAHALATGRVALNLVEGGGFEPPKLSRQIYSLIPLATREPLRKRAYILFTAQPLVNHIFRAFQALSAKLELARGVEPPTG